jgi:DNA topoisomerase IB
MALSEEYRGYPIGGPVQGGLIDQFVDQTGTIVRDLYGRSLASAFARAFPLPDPGYALRRDINAYEIMRRDPAVWDAMQWRKHYVAGSAWQFEPASDSNEDKLAASLMEGCFTPCENFDAARLNLSEAVFVGSRHAKPVGERRVLKLSDGVYRPWWVLTELRDLDRRRVRFVPVHGENGDEQVRTIVELFSVKRNAWVPIPDRRWMVQHVYDDTEATLGYGRGLLDALWFYWYAKTVVLEEGLQGLERWARGLILVKIDPDRPGSVGKSPTDLLTAALTAVEKSFGRNIMGCMVGDDIEVKAGPGEGHQRVLDMLNYLDGWITRLSKGSIRPSGGDAGPTGARAQAETEADTSAMIVKMDQKLLAGSITRDAAALVWRLNAGNLEAAGLGRAQMPRLKILHEVPPNPSAEAGTIQTILAAGIPLKRSEVYERIGFTPPGPGEDVIEPQATGPAGDEGALGALEALRGGAHGLEAHVLGRMAVLADRLERLGPTLDRLERYAADFREEQHPREGTGKFAPKGEGGAGTATLEDEPEPAAPEEAKPKKPRPPPPGSQLPEKQRVRLKALGVTKLPAHDATEIRVADLEDPDVDQKPTMTWRDTAGRTQYAYTAAFHVTHAAKKWERVQALEPAFDRLRDGLLHRLSETRIGSPERAAAAVAAIIAETGLRPGSAGSATAGHFGISTLRPEHVAFEGDRARLTFVGKSGKKNVTTVEHPEVVAALREAVAHPQPDGALFPAGTAERAREMAGTKLKDFRTIIATRTAERALKDAPKPPPPLTGDAKRDARLVARALRAASGVVAERLNNTPAVARASYIHPRVFEDWLERIGFHAPTVV